MAAADLPGLLADHDIRLKRLTPGHSEKIRCPKCQGGRTHEMSLSVTVDDDGEGAAWRCHRGKCGWTGGKRVRLDGGNGTRHPRREAITPSPPPPHSAEQQGNKPEWLYQFFAERRIGARTVDEFGIYAVNCRFADRVGDSPAIVFPYTYRGEVVNRKYRPHPAKTPQLQEKNALPTLFNVDRLGDAPDEVIFVEGEPDVLALFECGIPNAVTLKDGAGEEARFNPDDKRFAALTTHADKLGRIRQFVLAGDMDGPGLALGEELARRLGRHRCRLVVWPDGCKDACDTLREHGPEAVTAAIAKAEPYPIDGLHEIGPETLLALRYAPPPPRLTTGARATDAIMRLPGEGGRLIVVTGIPNHGKSSWVTFVLVHLMREHGRRFVVFSPEMAPWADYAALCAQVLVGCPFRPTTDDPGMSDGVIIAAQNWLRSRLHLLAADTLDDAPTLDWIIERAAASVLRDGTTDLLIDPWNEVESDRRNLSETEYIGRSLQRLRAFGMRYGVNAWVVCHPAKIYPAKPGEAIVPPGLYDISGSAHWANKPDIGITVFNAGDRTEILLTKARFGRWGRRGAKAILDFHKPTGLYHDIGAPRPLPADLGWDVQ
jgi:twinkle protein